MARKPPGELSPRYRRRIERAEARGLSRSQARGHPRSTEAAASAISGVELRGAAKRSAASKAGRFLAGLLPPMPAVVPRVPWSDATQGGTRDVNTTDPRMVKLALEEARARGRDVLLGIRSERIDWGPNKYTESKLRRLHERGEWAYSSRVRPEAPLGYIGGDSDAVAIANALRDYIEFETGSVVYDETRYVVKEFIRR